MILFAALFILLIMTTDTCPTSPQSILSNLSFIFDSKSKLSSAYTFVSTKWIGGNSLDGNELIDHTFGCGSLPLSRTENYTYYTIAGGLIHDVEETLIPRLQKYKWFEYAGISRFAPGVCAVVNCDTVALGFYPAIIPVHRFTNSFVFIYGMAFSKYGTLVSNVSAVEVWDGSGLSRFTPRGNVWFSTYWYISTGIPFAAARHIPLAKSIIAVTPILSIFGGKTPNATTAFVTIESINVQLFFLIPAISLGSGTGGIRRLNRNNPMDVCLPSGIFGRVNVGLRSPAFGKIVTGYLGPNFFFFDNSVDVAIHFQRKNGKRGLQSFQMRALSDLVVLNTHINRIIVQIQYLSPEEIDRRTKSRLKEYGCSCPKGYDANGVCLEPISKVDKWVQDRKIHDRVLTVSGEWSATLFWNLVGIKDLVFIFAAPSNYKPYMTLGGKLNVLFLRNAGGYIDIQHPSANFTLSTTIAGVFDVQIKGFSNTTDLMITNMYEVPIKNNTNADVSLHEAGNLFKLHWELSFKVRLSRGLKAIWRNVKQRFYNIVSSIHSSWMTIKHKLYHMYTQTLDFLHLRQNHTGSTLLEKRHLQYQYTELTNDLNIQMERNPALLYLMTGGKLVDPMFEQSDMVHFIKGKEDILVQLQVPLQLIEFNGQEYKIRNQTLEQSMNLTDPKSVELGFEYLKSATIELYSNSLSIGTNQAIM